MLKLLSKEEMSLVSGGFAPFIPVAVAVGSRFITNQFVKHQVTNGSLVYGTYKAAENMSNKK